MKLLYISTDYKWDMHGITRMLSEELSKRVDVTTVVTWNKGEALDDVCLADKYTHVMFANTATCCSQKAADTLRDRGTRLIGFGFSDPINIKDTVGHWNNFDHYFSLDRSVVAICQLDLGIDAHWLLPAVDPEVHFANRVDHSKAEFDCCFLGSVVGHRDQQIRENAVLDLAMLGMSVSIIEDMSPEAANSAMRNARIGLSVMAGESTLPHRIFEYSAAGLCILGSPRADMNAAFSPHTEYIPLDSPDLTNKLHDKEWCAEIAEAGRERCLNDHTIAKRVDQIMEVIA